jgi:hypothetical protein
VLAWHPEAIGDTRGGKPAADARDVPKAKQTGRRLAPDYHRAIHFGDAL